VSTPQEPSAPEASVPVIDREALRAKLAGAAPFKLIMATSDFGFRAKHIPGSLQANTHGHDGQLPALDRDDDIVVYCSNLDCNASKALIKQLRERGYRHVSHYAGGIIDWESAGFPLEGDWAQGPSAAR
jgi:rhodanese-related sulfurtransferase